MKFFELQEILDEELKDPEFKAIFEAEREILAAERAAYEAMLTLRKPRYKTKARQRAVA